MVRTEVRSPRKLMLANRSMRFSVGCELGYRVMVPTTLFLNVDAQRTGQQTVRADSFNIVPATPVEVHLVSETRNIYRRVLLNPGDYEIRYEAEVTSSPSILEAATVSDLAAADLPFHTLPYLYPSRYCQSDRLRHFAWREFGGSLRGHELVDEMCSWIHQKIDYLPGTSQLETSAYDTFTRRAGVCRDFAHLGVTFCRALGIPARFVSAYGWQLKQSDFHAVFEAYLGGRWCLFDPTRLCPMDGLVRIGVGRDAADTAFATFYGLIEDSPKKVWIDRLDATSDDALEWKPLAISTTST